MRNFEAIHQLNRGRPERAIARLDQPLAADFEGLNTANGTLAITIPIAARLNADRSSGVSGINTDVALTPRERASIIDAQALQLRGTALRLQGKLPEAKTALLTAQTQAIQVRDGRVSTIARMRGQILSELGLVEEGLGNEAEAEKRLREGLAVTQAQYPERRAVAGVQGRLASFLLRHGKSDEGLTLYRGLVERGLAAGGAATGFANELVPYFRALADRMGTDPAAAGEFFTAAQLLVRPGVAETQAVLARELSGGSDDAARLFRQTTDLSREIEQLRVRYLALQRVEDQTTVAGEIDTLAAHIRELEETQSTAQASLAAYPQYRAVSARAIGLADFQHQLGAGEAYARVALVGSDVMMFYADSGQAKAWRTPLSSVDLDTAVDLLRHSISVEENGRYVTYPFDMEQSRKLFVALFGPVAGDLAGVKHLIFEPDGALLRLPIDLLVTDDGSVARYTQRTAKPNSDPYDFRGTAWLGRGRMISTATSAQSFVDARKARPSEAREQYLGLGNNAPLGADPPPQVRALLASGNDGCGWTAAEWNHPIAATELVEASQVVGKNTSELLTGAAFTDTAVKQKSDLGDFRIIHFATHGLVTPAAARLPGQAGAADQLRHHRVGRAADVRRGVRPRARRRSGHPVRLRHGGLGLGRGDARGGPLERRWHRARRAGPRLHRGGRSRGARQPLARARRLPRHRAADERDVPPRPLSHAGRGAGPIRGIADGRRRNLAPLLLGGIRVDRRCHQAVARAIARAGGAETGRDGEWG